MCLFVEMLLCVVTHDVHFNQLANSQIVYGSNITHNKT